MKEKWIPIAVGLLAFASTQSAGFTQPALISVGQAQPLPQSQGPDTVCPLSDAQQQASQQAFAKIAAVFTGQPRCVNCHGGVNPFGPDAEKTHGGGKINFIFKTEPGALPGMPESTTEDDTATFKQCQDCHSAFPGEWRIPPADLFFVGKDAVTLCKQQKDFFGGDGSRFLNHIQHDADPQNPFIQEGFKGTRGLNDVGQSLASGPYPDPPKGVTHEDLNQMAQDWLNTTGGEWKGDFECGCVPHHYALNVDIELTSDTNANGAEIHIDISQKGQIPLSIHDDGSFSAQGALPAIENASASISGESCMGGYNTVVNWTVSGNIDESQKQIQFKTHYTIDPFAITVQCSGGDSGSIPVAGYDSSASENPLGAFALSTAVGSSQVYNFAVPGGTSSATMEIDQID